MDKQKGKGMNDPIEKKHSQWARFCFALVGLKSAWKSEASFRTEVIIGALVLIGMAWWQPTWPCWVAAVLALVFVLSLELVNTAIEHVCDALHPDQHPMIGIAKDCASAAVLIANLLGIVVVVGILIFGRK